MKGAVEGSVVKVEKTGGETNWVSLAYGPIANIEDGPDGEEKAFAERERDMNPPGD